MQYSIATTKTIGNIALNVIDKKLNSGRDSCRNVSVTNLEYFKMRILVSFWSRQEKFSIYRLKNVTFNDRAVFLSKY